MPKPASNSHRIAALDGWRGIAILMVLEDHFWSQQHPRWGHWGGLGVTIFFVLSGYLITGNLLRELDNGGIQLRRFYVRRAFRLWPCSWIYLAGIILMVSLSVHRLVWVDTWQCVLFVRNFFGHYILSGHFWTLSIEEQFYLLWPLALVLFRKRAAWIAAAGIIAVAFLRATHWSAWNDPFLSLESQYRADALMVGCLVALTAPKYPRIFANRRLLAVAFVGLTVLAVLPTRVSPTSEYLAIGAALFLTTQHPGLNRMFSFQPLTTLGLISYSLYVWQEIFANFAVPFHLLMIIPAILAAMLSYEYIERPGIRLGARLVRPKELQAVPV